MIALLRLAARNLLRYRRRTLLTASLVTIGVVAVLLFVSVAGSFRSMMIGQITDAMLGHLQVHRRGDVASTDSLPLNLNLSAEAAEAVTSALRGLDHVEAHSARLKFGAMLSNYSESTNVRITAVEPERERATVPLLAKRVQGASAQLLGRGDLLVPEILARGMKLAVGDSVVLVATNREGSVNGRAFRVAGVVEGLSGPGGRDGYLHIQDARELLRIDKPEITEIAVRLDAGASLPVVVRALKKKLDRGGASSAPLEVHTWRKLSPFSNIADMIDLLTLFVQVMLVSIVLISVMNVMVMAVYERIREIGTVAAIGVRPRTVLWLFLLEGLLLGAVGAAAGIVLSFAGIWILDAAEVTFSFGRQQDLILKPVLDLGTVLAVALAVMVVSALASLQPAVKASRMRPITALRHV
jgi:putative ABC transport system permease protein